MKTYRYFIFILFLGLLLLGCGKEKIMSFDRENGIYMNDLGIIRYNFAFGSDARMSDTINIPVNIVGLLTNEARPVAVRIMTGDGNTTAIEGTDYKLLPTAIAANRNGGNIQIVLLRNAGLKFEDKQIMIELMTNSFFPRYLYSDSINVNKQAKIIFADIFRKPDDWDGIFLGGIYYEGYGLGAQFGPYSEAKFRMVIDVFGSASIIPYNFPSFNSPAKSNGYFSGDQWRNLILVLQQRLLDYEEEHGVPMSDENGNRIVIPNFVPKL